MSIKRPTKDGSFSRLPNEMFLRIFSYLDLPTILRARAVTRKWKMLVDSSRNLIFTCHLSDETVATVVNSLGSFPCVKIHDFQQPVAVVSATRGVGRILANTEEIEVRGKNINQDELIKVMRFTARSLSHLSLQRCQRATLFALMKTTWTYECLTKLSIGFNRFPKRTHTRLFKQLADNQPFFPCLQHLKILYELDTVNQLYNAGNVPSVRDLFNNYFAIIQLIVAFKDSLKIVEVVRDEVLRTALVLRIDTIQIHLSPARQAEVQECIEELESVQLEGIHVTPLVEEGNYPWILETTLLQRQRQLQQITINGKLCSPQPALAQMSNLLPMNPASFTTIKISLTSFGAEPINLQFFAQCPNLQTLWLVFYRGVRVGPARQNTLHFSNLEHLPRSITSLHLKSSQQDAIIIHQQSILKREQIRWIIDNLRNLESFWLQLVAEETDDNVNNLHGLPPLLEPINLEEGGRPDGDDGHNIPHELEDQQEAQEAERLVRQLNEDLNVNANIDVDTFRALITMPRMREMKFDMLRAGQLGAILEVGADGNPWILPMGIDVSLDDIREYIDVCQGERGLSFFTETTNFFPFAFIELTITRKPPGSGPYFTR